MTRNARLFILGLGFKKADTSPRVPKDAAYQNLYFAL